MTRSGISVALLCLAFSVLDAQCIVGDCQNGFSKYMFKNGAVYEGEMSYGKIHGLGTLKFANGDIYKGILNTVDGYSYVGTFANNQLHGAVKVYDLDGGYFEGTWDKGINNAGGTYIQADGQKKKGYWSDAGFKIEKESFQSEVVEYLADCNQVKAEWCLRMDRCTQAFSSMACRMGKGSANTSTGRCLKDAGEMAGLQERDNMSIPMGWC